MEYGVLKESMKVLLTKFPGFVVDVFVFVIVVIVVVVIFVVVVVVTFVAVKLPAYWPMFISACVICLL